MSVTVLGIRHHGPGSARGVRQALDDLQPDAVLIEGPADADPLVALAASEGMQPPVALLAYAADEPAVAVFWPMAVFSPEWQAIRWAAEHAVPVRFMDLPASAVLGSTRRAKPAESAAQQEELEIEEDAGIEAGEPDPLRADPLALLAEAAGYDDPERWWDDVIESRGEGSFPAVAEAMAAVRESTPPPPGRAGRREERREAYMRQTIRVALKDGAERVAVVCGAWHAPALATPLPPAAPDARTLRGLRKRKVSLTWVPWTHSRLSVASGYGAGVVSPGWYHHLFTHPDLTVTRWLTRVAGVLRAEDLQVSGAHVIEAVRLAETLATLRGRPLAGLEEVQQATLAVLCDGDEGSLGLVTDRLVVGEALGTVPEETPTVPLEADLRAQARRLRLKQEPLARRLDLDLRRQIDADRSRLLHRLLLVRVRWGEPATSDVRSTGTFRESWNLAWRPELAVSVIEASTWGTTIAAAASATVLAAAEKATLAELTALVEACLLADLPAALPPLLNRLDERAALDTDVQHLLAALPPLVRALRYGDVRNTDTAALADVADAILLRACAALPPGLHGLDDDGAAAMRKVLDDAHTAVALRDDEAARERWLGTLSGLVDRQDVHGLIVGRIVRLLRDAGRIGPADTATRLGLALSVGTSAPEKAAWVEGFLAGGGLLLVHDAELLTLLDGWLGSLGPDEFVDVLPLVRRTFGEFATGERRIVADRVRRGPSTAPARSEGWDVDETRAAPAVAAVARLLGLGAVPDRGGVETPLEVS